MSILGDNVKRIRIEKGLSQDELAQRVGYTNRSTICCIESGKRDCSQKQIVALADALGVSPGDLLEKSNIPPNAMTVGERIKKLRIDLGMTQEELANKIGYKSRATVNKIETGTREITQSMIVKFANALYVKPTVIMGWEDVPKTVPRSVPICPLEQELLDNFRKLTEHGKKTAIERIKEMTELSIYTLKSGKK